MENEPYLPAVATPVEACDWLTARTSERWTIGRLLDAGLMPWFWLGWTPDAPPEVFNGHTEGYLAPVIFAGDGVRIRADRTVCITMTRTCDGDLFRIEPGMVGAVDDLRFKRADIESLASGPAQSGKPEATTHGEVTPHRISGGRQHALDAVIALAKKQAVDPNDDASVWASLVKLAESENPPPPILEMVEGEGIKYTNANGKVTFYSKRAFTAKMRRAR